MRKALRSLLVCSVLSIKYVGLSRPVGQTVGKKERYEDCAQRGTKREGRSSRDPQTIMGHKRGRNALKDLFGNIPHIGERGKVKGSGSRSMFTSESASRGTF